MIKTLSKRYVIFLLLKKNDIWIKDIGTQKKLLSKLYALLSSFRVVKDSTVTQWESDLNIKISNSVWEKIAILTTISHLIPL